MAPRTRRAQTMQMVSAPGTENESPVSLETSTPVNTSTQSRVPARMVLPESQSQIPRQGKSAHNYTETGLRLGAISIWETYLCTDSIPK